MGIFDILGYQYIIDNNQINDVADLISNTLLNLPQKVADKLILTTESEFVVDRFSSALTDNLQWRLFSDTILLSFFFAPKKPGASVTVKYLFFFEYISLLLRSAFDAGLPLRGAVDYGEFYIKENCFAGKAIINSYRLSRELQISGCAMTEALQKQFFADIESDEEFNKAISMLVCPYLVPLKENNAERLCLINWLCPFPDWKIPPDLRQYVADKFYAHNKDIPREALPKLENTEMTLSYFLSKKEEPPASG